MPIRIPNELPAARTLKSENIFVMTEQRAMGQDIRPLRILLLNLMPTKIATETQLSRLLSNTPLQVELELIAPQGHVPKNTPQEHMLAFYRHFDDVKANNYDGMVITGAPVEHLPFEEVEYWEELCGIMEWSKSHVHSTFHICWGAQAGLYYHYGVQKYPLEKKLFGIFPHIVERRSNMLFRGSDDVFMVPHSRPPGGHREGAPAEDPGHLSGGGNLRPVHRERPSDLHHRPQRVRRGHPGPGVPPGQEPGQAHRDPQKLLPQ